jgi:hypothetical protein
MKNKTLLMTTLASLMALLSANFCFGQSVASPSLVTVESPTFDEDLQAPGLSYNNLGMTSDIEDSGDASLQVNLANKKSFIIRFQSRSQADLFKKGMEEILTKYKIVIPVEWPVDNQLSVDAKEVKLQDLESGKTLSLENDRGYAAIVTRYEKREGELVDGRYNSNVLDLMQKIEDKKNGIGVFTSQGRGQPQWASVGIDSQKDVPAILDEATKTDEALIKAGHF